MRSPVLQLFVVSGSAGLTGSIAFGKNFACPGDPQGTGIAFAVFGLIGAACFFAFHVIRCKRKFSIAHVIFVTSVVGLLIAAVLFFGRLF